MNAEKPFRGPALTEAVRNYVKQYILDHHLSPGDSLPPETRLAQELGVGRSSVREAIKALQSLGIVEVRPGDGLYVREYNFDPVLETVTYGSRFDTSTLLDLAQIRTWLEMEIIEEAVRQARPEHVAQLEAVIQAWQEAVETGTTDLEILADMDRDFHRALYVSLGNSSLMKLLEVFWIVFLNLISEYIDPAGDLAQHEAILDAVKAGDPAAVRQALRQNQNLMHDRVRAGRESGRSRSDGRLEKPLRRPPLNEAIRNYIKQYILEHDLKPGDAFLTETELARELEVGRSSVREGVKALQSLGIIEVRRGGGLYVREYNFDPVLEILGYGMRFDTHTLLEFLQIRMWLETAVIRDAIQHVTDEDIQQLEEIIEPWRKQVEAGTADKDIIKDWDQSFHRALYEPLGNETVVKLIDVFWIAFGEFGGDYRNEPEVDLEDHVRIMEAVKSRDPEAAREAVRQNIARNQERFQMILESESGQVVATTVDLQKNLSGKKGRWK